MLWIADIEANGLDDATQIHCIVLKQYKGDKWVKLYGDSLKDISKYKDDIFVFHNGITYDIPLINRLLDVTIGECIDTLILSKMCFPLRPTHNLNDWGEYFGIEKPKHEDWSTFSPEMLHRCEEDVKITELLYEHLMKETGPFYETRG